MNFWPFCKPCRHKKKLIHKDIPIEEEIAEDTVEVKALELHM